MGVNLSSAKGSGFIINIGIAAVVFFVAFKVYRFLNPKPDAEDLANKDIEDKMKSRLKEIDNLGKIAEKKYPQIKFKTDSYYLQIANDVQKILNPSSTGVIIWDSISDQRFNLAWKKLTGFDSDLIGKVSNSELKWTHSIPEIQKIYSMFGVRDFKTGLFYKDVKSLDMFGFFNYIANSSQTKLLQILINWVNKK